MGLVVCQILGPDVDVDLVRRWPRSRDKGRRTEKGCLRRTVGIPPWSGYGVARLCRNMLRRGCRFAEAGASPPQAAKILLGVYFHT